MSVRMGKMPGGIISINGTVDYANLYYDNLMDMYLTKECKFYVNDPSGVDVFAYMYGKPHVFVNDVAAMAIPGVGGYPQSEDSILIFKKIWDTDKGRFLRFDETLDMQLAVFRDEISLDERQKLVFVDNSEEDILEAVIEMNDRLDGIWAESKDDIALQEKVKQKIKEHCAVHGLTGNRCYIGRIGSLFIRKNRYILGL